MRVAIQFASDIHLSSRMAPIEVDGEYVDSQTNIYRVNAKSIMGLLTLSVTQGAVVHIEAVGPDAEEACQAIKEIIESGLGEE